MYALAVDSRHLASSRVISWPQIKLMRLIVAEKHALTHEQSLAAAAASSDSANTANAVGGAVALQYQVLSPHLLHPPSHPS